MMTIVAATVGLLASTVATPPPSRTVDATETLFGTVVRDPYRWLEDAASGEVQGWMTAQDNAARATLARISFRGALRARLAELAGVEKIAVPAQRGGRLFHERRPKGAEKAILYWRTDADGRDRVLLDPAGLSADGSTALSTWIPSPRGTKLAYGVAAKNADEQVLRVRDVDSGRDLPDVVPGARWSGAAWTPDDAGFYYTHTPPADAQIHEAQRAAHSTLRYHRLGTDASRDPVVHGPTGDASHSLGPQVTPDGRWLLAITYRGWTAADIEILDLSVPSAPWRPLIVGVDAQFMADYHQGVFYLRTDDGAPRGRVIAVDPHHPDRSHWRELVPELPDATLQSAFIVGGQLVVHVTRKACDEVEIRGLDGRLRHKLALPPNIALEGLGGEPDRPDLFVGFSGLTRPVTVLRGGVDTPVLKPWAEQQVPRADLLDRLEAKQVTYPSKDGTPVTMFIVHPKGAPRDGSTPFYLTGYGGFSIGLGPSFSGRRLPWLEAGGGLAIPNLRGGSEYGEAWHRAGMRDKKQNVFDDFLAAADFLVREGYTRPERLVISGRSNGGLLVGAALTQRPQAFRAVVCGVPLLDMVRYHRFGAGMTWTDEYGSSETEAGFRALYAYSPYHHVTPGVKYPSVLFLSADTDDRVDPLHARKMTAALQAATSGAAGGGPILLRIEVNAGHAGADRVSQEVEEDADVWAFALDAVGLKPR